MRLYVHAIGTSKMHASARRKFEYESKCRQCGCDLSSGHNAVAAHVVVYRWPISCPCVGRMGLITMCSKCNAAHRVSDKSKQEPCCVPRARIWTRRRDGFKGVTRNATQNPAKPLAKKYFVYKLWCWRKATKKPNCR